ncbi:MAG: hypothetical protein SGI86_00895 [Deltaproteobacteria bacterium]|nr:hypothetical protein [Deltaproteobacteria bacterium]
MASRVFLFLFAVSAIACSLNDSNLVVEKTGTGGTGGTTSSGTDPVAGLSGSEGGTDGTEMASGGAGGADGRAKGGSGGTPNMGGSNRTGGTVGTSVGGKGGSPSAMGGTGGTGTGGTVSGTGGTATGTGGKAGSPATGGTSGTDGIRFHFEADTQEWRDLTFARCPACAVHEPVRTESKAFSGKASLAYDVENGGPSRERIVGVARDNIGPLVPGAVITFHVFLPETHPFVSIESFVQTARIGSWTADRRVAGQLLAGQWNTFVVTVPEAFKDERPIELGVLFLLANGMAKTTVHIDHVVFVPGP